MSAGAIFPSAVVVMSHPQQLILDFVAHFVCWQGQRASNPQPSVLETDALPIELCPYYSVLRYSMIFATTPPPTVLPPSRMAKRRPCSIAIGVISVTTIFTLSPGITISVPLGNSAAPVTSVVLK